jgi:pescadillo
MGNRVKGRPKKSSIKAALSSSAGSKRKLSRMGKKQKKEHAGLEASFIGRSACLKMLQITIKDFRRLCILKGIYPRQPAGRVPGKKKGQTFYHIKDIRAIAHEPILEKFREFRAFMKKVRSVLYVQSRGNVRFHHLTRLLSSTFSQVRRAAGRNEGNEALRKNSVLPTYSLHSLVKERYPRFVDAISDLDDALTLTYLFAALPSDRDIKPKYITKAKALAAAWGAYCATTSAVTKSFISVKGVYMEAEIQGVPIRWIVPHAFTQHLPEDVDFRVMNTFFEFYETMLNFILFKLYNDIGLRYPFTVKDLGGEAIGSTSAILGSHLRALTNAMNSSSGAISNIVSDAVQKESAENETSAPKGKADKKKSKELIKSVGAALNKLKEEDSDMDRDDDDDDDDSVDVAGPLQAALENVANEEARFSLPGVKDTIGDDALKRKRLFERLTFFFSREVPRGYLELVCLAYGAKVGWEGDDSPISMKDPSITHHIVDRPKLPSSYESLPKSREYIQPQWILDCANFLFLLPIAKYEAGATLPPHLSPWVDDEEEGYKPKYAVEIERLKNGETVHTEEIDAEDSEDEAETVSEKVDAAVEEEEEEKESEEEEEEVKLDIKKAQEKQKRKREKEEEETHKLAKTMMSRKATHLYGRMQHGIARKQAKVDALNQRRKELIVDSKDNGKERDGSGRLIITGREKDSSGKTTNKLKVERLKNERKTIEDDYAKTSGTMKKSKKGRRS